jgi:endonuclease/exonuclease/phosphatase family metal-dependent hydrolase
MNDATAVVRVLTWNIHRGVGRDGRYDLRPIVALVRRHDPDIVALQEIDSRGRVDDRQAPPLAFLTQSLGSHVAEARTIEAPDGHYGHALISRWPLAPPILHDLSVRRHEPRFAIETTAATASGPVHLAAVHLGLRIGERRWQAATLAAALPARTFHRTYPARRPLLMLDRIYCRPPSALLRSWTDPAARRLSDHLPVIAEIRVAPSTLAGHPWGGLKNKWV